MKERKTIFPDRKYDVVCAGIATVDLMADTVDSGALFRDTTRLRSLTMSTGGDAVNQATVLARLGVRTALCALAGKDLWGDFLVRELEKESIDCGGVLRTDEVPTTVAIAMIDENRERHFAVKSGSTWAFSLDHIDRGLIRDAGILSLASSFSLKGLDGEPTVELLQFAKECGCLTAVDYNIGNELRSLDRDLVRRMLALTDFAMPSLREARMLAGMEETADAPAGRDAGLRADLRASARRAEIEEMAARIAEMGAKCVIIKLGADGCYVRGTDPADRTAPANRTAPAASAFIPAYPARTADTTGAGDSFVAGFLSAFVRGEDLLSCARFGCAAGSCAVEAVGATAGVRDAKQVRERMAAVTP